MGYSKNPQTLQNRASLFSNNAKSWKVAPGMADKLAYQIRECFYIALLYEKKFPEVAKLARQYRVVVTSPVSVALKAAVGTVEAVALTEPESMVIQGIAPETPDVDEESTYTTASAIVTQWMNAQPSNDRMVFPSTQLPAAELIKLYKWATERTPPWAILVDVEGTITLTLHSRDLAPYYWTPDDLL